MDHLPLEVREVDRVVVDDPQRADPGRRQVQRHRRTEPAGAEQQHLGFEQLLLPLEPDLVEEQVTRVTLALLGAQRLRDIDFIAAVLPQRDPAAHRFDVLVAEIVDQGPRRIRRALSGRAVQDHVLRAIGDRALDPGLEIAARHVLGSGNVAGGELLSLADVDDRRPVVHLGMHVGRVDLVDPVLDLA